MAVKNLKSLFRKDLDKARKTWTKEFVPNSSTIVEFTLGGSAAYKDFPIATKKVIKAFAESANLFPEELEKLLAPLNTASNWKKAGATVLKRYARTKSIGTFTSLKPQPKGNKVTRGTYINQPINSVGNEMKIAIWESKATSKGRINNIYDTFTKDIWKQWTKNHKIAERMNVIADPDTKINRMSGVGKNRKLITDTVIGTFRSSAKREHSPDTTTASQGIRDLEQGLSSSSPGVDYGFNVTTFDIIQHIKANTKIDWSLKTTKSKIGKYKATNVIKLSLGKNPNNLDSDLIKIMKKAEQSIRDRLEETTKGYLSDKDFEASTSIADQIAGDISADLLGPFTKAGLPDMRYKKNKNAFAQKNRKETLVRPSGYKPKTGKLNISAAATLVKPKSKKRQAQREDETLNLLKLEKMINKRLPAEVRRNMGRPALINQTGRFSNSVEVTELRETKAGLSGEYTYELNPYETFENTGSKRWPSGYNPKPLIAKSIRNLALQYTEQKLTSLRRV